MLEPSVAAITLTNSVGLESLGVDNDMSILVLNTVESAEDKSAVVLGDPSNLANDELLRLKGLNRNRLVLALRHIQDVELHIGDTVEHIRTTVRSDLIDLAIAAADEKVIVAHKSNSIPIGRKLSVLNIANLVVNKRLTLARLNIENEVIGKVRVAVLLGVVGSNQDLFRVTANPVLVQILGELIGRDKLGGLLREDILQNEIAVVTEDDVVSVTAGRRPVNAYRGRSQFGARARLVKGEETISLACGLMGLARRIDSQTQRGQSQKSGQNDFGSHF
ncbi:hypothetical protein HG531_010797 [Fusarium graminearum]|nr:hypothetical protein HG531_010797 [Fusarium graminearum]